MSEKVVRTPDVGDFKDWITGLELYAQSLRADFDYLCAVEKGFIFDEDFEAHDRLMALVADAKKALRDLIPDD